MDLIYEYSVTLGLHEIYIISKAHTNNIGANDDHFHVFLTKPHSRLHTQMLHQVG